VANTLVTLGNLEIAEVKGEKVCRCLKCGYFLCPITQDYKDFALKNEAPIFKAQPGYLASKTGKFVLREYYCPQCGAMFEVNMVSTDQKQIWSVQLK